MWVCLVEICPLREGVHFVHALQWLFLSRGSAPAGLYAWIWCFLGVLPCAGGMVGMVFGGPTSARGSLVGLVVCVWTLRGWHLAFPVPGW